MKTKSLHSFAVTYKEALAIQESLKKELILSDGEERALICIAGADISCEKGGDLFFAAVVLCSYPDMEIIEEAHAVERATFPYIPGLLTFREGPCLLKAFNKLRRTPDLVIFDGQGIAHPRGMGLASHMGLFLDLPAVGCAKSRLWGSHAEPGTVRGDSVPLLQDGEIIGAVLRTKDRVKPLYISQGHRIGLERAVEAVLSCCRGYRLPEPVRMAHLAVNRLRLEAKIPPNPPLKRG